MYLHTKDGWFVLRKDPFMWWKQFDGPLQTSHPALTKLSSDEIAVQVSLGLIPGIYLMRSRNRYVSIR